MAGTNGRSPTSGTTAAAPFNDPYGDADIIIHSSDGIKFYLHQVILRFASAFFADMFSLPQSSTSNSSRIGGDTLVTLTELQIIHSDENAQVLDRLLRFCYPVKRPALEAVQDVASLLKVGSKYLMEEVVSIAKEALLALHASEPLPVFAVACNGELEDIALVAAKSFSSRSLRNWRQHHDALHPINSYALEMDNISALSYFRLLQYYCADKDGKTRFESQRDEDASYRFCLPFRHAPPQSSLGSKDVLFPFQDASLGDVIVRSSDDVDFYVQHQVIALASPVWKQLLSEPPDYTINVDTASTSCEPLRRVLRMSDNSSTLSILLQLCYPMPDPPMEGPSADAILSSARLILHAATAYQVQRAVDFAKRVYMSFLEHHPTRVYLTAARFNWESEAKSAALHSVYQDVDDEAPEMADVTAAVYRRLLVYRESCRQIVMSDRTADQSSMYWNGYPAARVTRSWLVDPDDGPFWLLVHKHAARTTAVGRPLKIEDIGPVIRGVTMLLPFETRLISPLAPWATQATQAAVDTVGLYKQRVITVAEALTKVEL